MRMLRGVLLALPLFAFLPGCPIWTDDGDDGPGRDCDRDLDCRTGEICSIDGECVPTGECDDDGDCEDGFVCSASRTCVPSGPSTCRVDGDCTAGEVCTDGECTPSGTCENDEDCADGLWCDPRGTCAPRPANACRANADCAASEVCIEGYCRPIDDTCGRDRDCAPGNVCLNNECTGVCTNDAGCAAGDSCQNGFCRPADECTTTSQCDLGEHCVDDRCLPDCSSAARTCGAGSYCAPEDSFCRPDWEPEPFCDEDSDCMTGRKCVAGVCRTPCPTMQDSQCLSIDAQLPLCRPEGGVYYCFATSETMTPECRRESDCADGRDCLNGTCRNR
ncbi:hypothetical protein [Sandaracinus amylolyticus]|uniref:hypothetical protein n=1 Tax=Sandaracinus amylolyticus TaxID=927083 RepID=UPI001F163834|nr:hypothetical protein [Sandaracinus amylolyticus]UJR78844.1 18K peptidoglycan-associated outer membrane lipoprotein [Sandaracinus amylolyticus]